MIQADKEEHWNGLPRDLIMWMDMYEGNKKTPRNLFYHLRMIGTSVPNWLENEAEMKNLDSVPSKGTRVMIIFRAVLENAIAAEVKSRAKEVQNAQSTV